MQELPLYVAEDRARELIVLHAIPGMSTKSEFSLVGQEKCIELRVSYLGESTRECQTAGPSPLFDMSESW
jgi:hypothetical protein